MSSFKWKWFWLSTKIKTFFYFPPKHSFFLSILLTEIKKRLVKHIYPKFLAIISDLDTCLFDERKRYRNLFRKIKIEWRKTQLNINFQIDYATKTNIILIIGACWGFHKFFSQVQGMQRTKMFVLLFTWFTQWIL